MLSRLKELRNNIKVAIIGMGAMGNGLLYQCHITPGIECVAIADIKIDKAVACVNWMKMKYRIVRKLEDIHKTIRQGLVAVCENGNLLARCEMVDVLVESSNSIAAAGQFSITALEHRKHIVLANAEVDLIFGPYLMKLAQDYGVVYTSCDGDQHSVIKHLIDDLQLWGFDLVMAGNIKGFLDRYANPTKIIPEADKRNLDYKIATSFTDGTKLCVEMALVANAIGLSTLIPGMQGPRANHIRDVFHLFDFNVLWENKQPLVDYILGPELGGGVFAIGYCDSEYQKSKLSYYKMGDGPFYLFYRPFHLCHVEAMASVAKAFLDKRAIMQPSFGFQTNVYAYAKRDLHRGERLDGIGGYTCYGLIKNCPRNEDHPSLPICLAEDVKLKRDVAKDGEILMSDIDYDPNRFDFELCFKALEQSSGMTL